MRHIISLTSIPPRFADLGLTLRSLVRQTSRPEAVELYIPRFYRRFPQWGGALPEVPDGVRIVRVDDDLGPATKVLPAARAWRGTGVELFHADDDRIYAPSLLRAFLAVRKVHPEAVICGAGFHITERYGYPAFDAPPPRAVLAGDPMQTLGFQLRRLLLAARPRRPGQLRRAPYWRRFVQSGHVDVAEGFGGVLIKPEYLDEAAFAIPPVVWAVDDVWLSGTYARRGVKIWADLGLHRVETAVDVSLTHPLYKAVIEGADRRQADRACIDHMQQTYGIWGGVAAQST